MSKASAITLAQWALERRISRLKSARGFFRFLAVDHGLSHGPISGIEDVAKIIHRGIELGFTGVVATPGIVSQLPPELPASVILQTFGMPDTTDHAIPKVRIASMDTVLRASPDAIAVQLQLFGAEGLRLLGKVARTISEALSFGIPVVLMINVADSKTY